MATQTTPSYANAAWPNNFNPRPGNFGIIPAWLPSDLIGGTANIGSTTPMTANATVVYPIGCPARPSYFNGGNVMIQTTLPIDADGTCLAYLAKYDVSAAAYVVLTGSVDLETATSVLLQPQYFVPATGLTEAQAFFDDQDWVALQLVSNSAAIDTQLAGLKAVAGFVVAQ